jgi:hypothetical protein
MACLWMIGVSRALQPLRYRWGKLVPGHAAVAGRDATSVAIVATKRQAGRREMAPAARGDSLRRLASAQTDRSQHREHDHRST